MSLTGIAGVILAAGESSRMGRDKALLPWPPASANAKPSAGPQSTILSSAIQAFLGFCDITIVVAGRNEPALRPVVYACGASIICNPAPERGQFSSMQTGLQEVLNLGRDSAMITLIDRPPPRSETLNALVNAFASREHGVWAIVPEHGGQHGHPILIGREMMEAFLRAPATGNAREVEHANQDRIRYVAVNDALVTTNIDTPNEYAMLQSGI
jgi:CTP:molybdopterin cytidylyltransferase MocA